MSFHKIQIKGKMKAKLKDVGMISAIIAEHFLDLICVEKSAMDAYEMIALISITFNERFEGVVDWGSDDYTQYGFKTSGCWDEAVQEFAYDALKKVLEKLPSASGAVTQSSTTLENLAEMVLELSGGSTSLASKKYTLINPCIGHDEIGCWGEGERPHLFDSREEAQTELDEVNDDLQFALEQGDIEDIGESMYIVEVTRHGNIFSFKDCDVPDYNYVKKTYLI